MIPALDIVAEDREPKTPAVYWFANGEIWSALGEPHPLSIGGANAVLADLARRADPNSRLYWPNACDDLRRQLTEAINAYRTFWKARLEQFA